MVGLAGFWLVWLVCFDFGWFGWFRILAITFLVQVKLAWASLCSSLQQVPRSRMIISQVNGLHPSCLDIKSKGTRHIFIFARKSTDIRCEMFMSIHIKKPVHMNSLLSKDANLNFKYLQSSRDRDFQDWDSKSLLIFPMPAKAHKFLLYM